MGDVADDFDPDVALLAAERARRKKVLLALGGAGVVVLMLAFAIFANVSSDAKEEEKERARLADFDRNKRVEEERQAATEKAKNRADLPGLLATAARGGNTTPNIASFFVTEQMEGYSVDDPTPSIASREDGTVRFNERAIPAAVIKASFVSTNRVEGRRRTVCIYAAAGYDAEFKMWRQIIAKGCDAADAQDVVDGWKKENGFSLEKGR